MAKDGKKLELFEILAAERAKGRMPLKIEQKTVRQANSPDPEEESGRPEVPLRPAVPGVIVDEAVAEEQARCSGAETTFEPPPVRDMYERRPRTQVKVQDEPAAAPEPDPAPKARSPREVVFTLDLAFILFFLPLLGLIACSYMLGYKRGQEERPTGLAGIADIALSDPDEFNLRHLGPAPRTTLRPPEQEYTLILRTEPATDDLPERLELELAEAVARGRQAGGGDIQGFIFRSGGNDPRYVLTVGLGSAANDAGLARLQQIYYGMEGMTLSREPMPYRGARVGPVRELGVPVY